MTLYISQKPLIFDLDYKALEAELESLQEPRYRTDQLWRGLYHELWSDFNQFTSLPASLREKLSERYDFSHLQPQKILELSDGETRKVLFSQQNTPGIEAVLMRYAKRRTLCISSQAGCALGCVFCATGQMGFHKNLTSGEIIEQVLHFARELKLQAEKITNIVIMGMGEPFNNYDAVLSAIDRLNDHRGADLGARRFTISTVGLVPGIRRFTQEHRQVNLAISLHAADDDLRGKLLPINQKYPLAPLMAACRDYVNQTSRRISFEWALIQDINDSLAQAEKLAKLLQPFIIQGSALCHVNMILLNPTRKYSGKASPISRAQDFQKLLEKSGIPCTIRLRRGVDIQAGCGQLASG